MTGAEPDLGTVVRRIEAFPGELHEVRLDCLSGGEQELGGLRRFGRRVLATLRTAQQGGRFAGDHDAYEQRVVRLFDEHAFLVDVEWADAPHVQRLMARGQDRVVLSWHGRVPDDDALEGIARSMAASSAGVRKLALHVDDAAELDRVLRVTRLLPKPYVVLGLGEAGRASRILHACFGSAWTFVSVGDAVPGAPGQLSVEDARAMIPGTDAPIPLGIVGGRQVAHSPGLRVYNRVFRRRGLPFSYVAWPTARLAASLDLMARLGFRGVSVTMPYKQAALAHCARVDAHARRMGAINSLVREGDGWAGYNTDAGAVRDAVLAAGGAPGERAAVLGLGGAARAAAAALATEGFRVEMFGRNLATAGDVHETHGHVALRDWAEFDARGYQVVVNATPVGSNGVDCPIAQTSELAGRIVMEMIHTPETTPLVALARRQGARVISGRDMWLFQAVEQMRHFIGLELSKEELAQAWPEGPQP